LFASRSSAIRSVQARPASVNPRAVLQYLLFSSVPAPLAIDQGMERLRPGTFITFESGRAVERQYWDLQYPESSNRSVAHWSRALREEMRSSVHRHLEGCEAERTGCYLSGGTDSSSVVAFASEIHSHAQSFSIAFQEAGFSEIEFARTTAARFQTRHHERWLTPNDAWVALEKLVAYYDEPFANSSAIGSYYCALMAREQGVDVLLAGDGGDEIFGGNERYARDKYFSLYHSLPEWLRSRLIEPVVRLFPENNGALSLPRKYVRRANIPNPRRIFSYGFFLSTPPEEVFEGEFLRDVGAEDWLAIAERHFRTPGATSELNRILYLDVKMTLADNDLRKVSGTAELAGVNVRYPLLDDRLVELSGGIPAALKLRRFEKRYIFKQAMKEILPDKILYKKKHGFGVPLAQWLLSEPRMRELMHDVMHDARTRQRGYFRPEFFERLMSLHQQQPNFYGEIVWYLLMLELWHRKHFDRSRDTVHAA
jgi:asparagine synthase (glutamine-hydrolysing)